MRKHPQTKSWFTITNPTRDFDLAAQYRSRNTFAYNLYGQGLIIPNAD
ncbi:MAG: hypothetical protein WDA18_04705 [Candidatus Ratteibacteria bacterium]